MIKSISLALDEISRTIMLWGFVQIERAMTFTRADGKPMLYLKAKTRKHYLHVEGLMVNGELRFYCKLTQSTRNKHSHKDEIIGWDNLYNAQPHIHYDNGKRREYRMEPITWQEIKQTIGKLEERS